jgi:hypothetical protein
LVTLPLGYAFSSILLGVFIFYAFLYMLLSIKTPRFEVALILPLLLYSLFCLSAIWTTDINLTLKGLSRTISLFLVPFAFGILPRIARDEYSIILNVFSKANVVFGLFFISTSIYRYSVSRNLDEITYHALVSNLGLNAVYVSAFFTVSFFFLIQRINKSKINLICAAFLFLMIVLLSSKVFVLILFLGLLVYVIKFKILRKIKIKKLIVVSLIGVLMSVFASKEILRRVSVESETNLKEVITRKTFNRVYPWTGTSIRLLQLRILREQIMEEKLFWNGFGLFASRNDLKIRHKSFNTYFGYHSYNYHNTYAQTLAETGIFGLLIIILMLAVNIFNAIKSDSFTFLMFSILTIFWFFTESVLWVQRGIFFFIVFYCLFNRIEPNNTTSTETSRQ